MDRGLITAIVDLLRRGKENQALNQGGPTVGTPQMPGMPVGVEPRHDGEDINETIARMSR